MDDENNSISNEGLGKEVREQVGYTDACETCQRLLEGKSTVLSVHA